MRRSGSLMLLVGGLVGFLLIVPPAYSATVGYWRFESEVDFLEDSGPNNLDLTANGSPAPSYYALPGTGDGSDFPDPIPLTSEANNGAADFTSTTSGANFSHVDDPLFAVQDFTIEVMFNRAHKDSRMLLASQYETGTDQRSWYLAVVREELGNFIMFGVCEAGGTSYMYRHSADEILSVGELDHDYYVAVSFDVSDHESGIKFYIKDLTTDAPMQMDEDDHTINTLHDSTADFVIGERIDGNHHFSGIIDEVRLSDCVLSNDELLIPYVSPKPGDANRDGYVDDSDATILAAHWLTSTQIGWVEGDFNKDGVINDIDATLMATNWTGPPEASASVPEPAALLCLLTLLLGFGSYCRFSRS